MQQPAPRIISHWCRLEGLEEEEEEEEEGSSNGLLVNDPTHPTSAANNVSVVCAGGISGNGCGGVRE